MGGDDAAAAVPGHAADADRLRDRPFGTSSSDWPFDSSAGGRVDVGMLASGSSAEAHLHRSPRETQVYPRLKKKNKERGKRKKKKEGKRKRKRKRKE